jgi:hypothetical protein
MAKVILQPCASVDALRHYEDTIRRPVPLARVEPYLEDRDFQALKSLYPSGLVPTWGVTPGGANEQKWKRISPGDIALFTGQGRAFASGVVRLKATNRALATDLWGTDDDGRTWEHLYFLDDISELEIPYASLNAAAGYVDAFIPLGFSVLAESRSEAVIATLGLGGVSERQFDHAARELGLLDRKVEVLVRTEQGFLRRVLFGSELRGQCIICGRVFPVGLLVAAHIKQRAECSEAERADYRRNVVPMCVLGCDDLFERGYIAVVRGTIVVNEMLNAQATPAVQEYLRAVKGRGCAHWNKAEPYFEWHRQQHELDGGASD